MSIVMKPFELPVGVRHMPTRASMSTWWRDANHIRWVDKQMQPVGGWSRLQYNITDEIGTHPMVDFPTPIRKILVWVANDGQQYTAFLCEDSVFLDDGSGVVIDITPTGGMPSPTTPVEGGYGNDLYSLELYGTPRPDQDRPRPIPPCYTLANWGEDLLVMTSMDGRLLRWKPSVGGLLVQVPGSPVGRCFVVTPERFVIVFGKDGIPNKFGWCDQENIEEWTVAITTKVGNYTIQPAAPIVSAIVVGNGEVIFWTTVQPFVIRFIGLPYVYVYTVLGGGSTPLSPASACSIPNGVVWVSESGFYKYTGGSIYPIDCPIWEWITDHWDSVGARYEAFIVDIFAPPEVWWFFPVSGSDAILPRNSRYAIFNYEQGWFSMGRLERSAGFSGSYSQLPVLADYTITYRHEYGNSYPNAELPWIESYSINAVSGGLYTYLDQMLPDVEGDVENLDFVFVMNTTRVITDDRLELEKKSPVKKVNGQGLVNIRETARDFRMRIQSNNQVNGRWSLGQALLGAVSRGQQ